MMVSVSDILPSKDVIVGAIRLCACALLGAVLRAAYAMDRASEEIGVVRPRWGRVVRDIACSALFGGAAALLLLEFGWMGSGLTVGKAVGAVAGGFLGVKLLESLPAKFGISDDFGDAIPMSPSELSDRQRKAVKYARDVGDIRNKDYRGMFKVSDSTAQRELASLVSRRYLSKDGVGKGARYHFGG